VPAILQRVFPPSLIPLTPSLSFSSELLQADIIQSAEFYQLSTFSASNLAAKNRIPLFVWQEAFHYMRTPAKPFQRVFDLTAGRSIKAATTKFILRTKKARNFLNEIGVSSSSIGPWIPTGIDGDSFQPRSGTLSPEDFGFPKDFAIILVVARLTPSKGADLAIQAEAILRTKGVKVGLIIRGSGPELNNLKTMVKELKIEYCVRFLGPQSRAKMANLYNSSDVFLLASKTDLFPFTLLEAAGCGLPSVATRVGCIEDFVQNGINGLLVLPSPRKIAEGLEKVLKDDALGKKLGYEARQNFINEFDMHTVAKHFTEFYSKYAP